MYWVSLCMGLPKLTYCAKFTVLFLTHSTNRCCCNHWKDKVNCEKNFHFTCYARTYSMLYHNSNLTRGRPLTGLPPTGIPGIKQLSHIEYSLNRAVLRGCWSLFNVYEISWTDYLFIHETTEACFNIKLCRSYGQLGSMCMP